MVGSTEPSDLTRVNSQLPTPNFQLSPKSQLPTRVQALGVYVHIPFCSSICNYCNFNRGLYDEAIKRARAAAELVKDRRQINEEGETIESDVSPELAGQRI